eukprot:326235_1
MPSYGEHVLGGQDGSNIILDTKAIKQLKHDTKIAGNWKIAELKSTSIRKKPNHLLICLYLLDGYEDMQENNNNYDKNKLLQARIWNYPKTEPIPQPNDLLIVEEKKATVRNFNGLHQIHIQYKHIEFQNMNINNDKYESDDEDIDIDITYKQTSDVSTNCSNKYNYSHSYQMNNNNCNTQNKMKICDVINDLFCWLVHNFDLFIHIRNKYKLPLSIPSFDSFNISKNNFLKLLIIEITNRDLKIKDNDKLMLYGLEGDIILENMTFNQRQQTKRLLRDDKINELSGFNKIILQKLKLLVLNHKGNNTKGYTYNEIQLHSKYNKFPLKNDYVKLSTLIVYHILGSSIQITKRHPIQLKKEQTDFEKYCVNHLHEYHKNTKDYAKYYMTLLCKLCFNSRIILTHSLNIEFNGDCYINICDNCHKKINSAMSYWELYESMLNWDDGWNLLFSNKCNDSYLSMIGVLCAVIFRNVDCKIGIIN